MHQLPIQACSVFKFALLVYKYLQTDYPNYFDNYLKIRQSAYNIRLSQSDGVILEIPQFAPSVHKSKKHFGFSFAFDAPKIWNGLPDEVKLASSLSYFRKKLEDLPLCQGLPTLVISFHKLPSPPWC